MREGTPNTSLECICEPHNKQSLKKTGQNTIKQTPVIQNTSPCASILSRIYVEETLVIDETLKSYQFFFYAYNEICGGFIYRAYENETHTSQRQPIFTSETTPGGAWVSQDRTYLKESDYRITCVRSDQWTPTSSYLAESNKKKRNTYIHFF